MKKSTSLKVGAVLLGAVLLGTTACSSGGNGDSGASSGDETFKFTVASGVAETHPTAQSTVQWMDRVTELTDGRVTFDPVWSGALLPAAELLAGVKDGRADISHTSTSWHMSDLPLTSISTVPFITYDGEAGVRALNDLYENSEALNSEYAAAGVELITVQPLDVVLIGATQKLTDINGLDGTQIRATGEWIEALSMIGSEPVEVPYGEIYEAVQRGVVDGYALNWEAVYDLQLHEVAPVMEDPGIGQISSMMLVFNDAKWAGLPDDIRAAFDQATTEQVEGFSALAESLSVEQCQTMVDAGAEFNEWSAAAKDEWRNLTAEPIHQSWIDGLPNPAAGQQFFDEYVSMVDELAATSQWKPGLEICNSL